MLLSYMQNTNKVALFDLDDFLIETHAAFKDGIDKILCDIAQRFGIDPEELSLNFGKCLSAAKKIHNVVPTELWTETLNLLAGIYPQIDQSLCREYVTQLLVEIYGRPIKLKPGAKETLEHFKQQGYTIGILTNAGDDWTNFKLAMVGLNTIVRQEDICTVPPHIPKQAEHWKAAFNKIAPHATVKIVGGDNLLGDVCAGLEAGADLAFWLYEPNSNAHTHLNGEIPDKYKDKVIVTYTLNSIPEWMRLVQTDSETTMKLR